MAIPGNLRSMVPPDRRDWALVASGVMSLFVAYAYGAVTVPTTSRGPLSTVTALVPLRVLAAVWATGGAYCIAAAFTDRKLYAWGVASFLPAGWGGLYFASWVHGDPGRGWVSAGIFWSFSVFVTLAALLVDPRLPPTRRRQ